MRVVWSAKCERRNDDPEAADMAEEEEADESAESGGIGEPTEEMADSGALSDCGPSSACYVCVCFKAR